MLESEKEIEESPVGEGPFVPAALAPRKILPAEFALLLLELTSNVPTATAPTAADPDETKILPAALVPELLMLLTLIDPAATNATDPPLPPFDEVKTEPSIMMLLVKLTTPALPPLQEGPAHPPE